jgi:uncharacterized protein YbaR (Trm112 family)
MIAPELLAILACPLDSERPPLRLEGQYLICEKCGHGFEIVDGIPHLLPDEAIEPDRLKELLDGI